MSARIQVQFQDMVEDSPDTVAIRSPELRNELIQHQSEAVRALTEQIAPIQLEHISIDDQGRVVITDAAFAAVLGARRRTEGGAESLMSVNGLCYNRGCAAVA